MKKLLITLALSVMSTALYALPLGNPWESALHQNGLICHDFPLSLRLGFYGDFVFNRRMEIKATKSAIRRAEIFTQAGYLALNAFDHIDFFATLGTTNIYLVSPDVAFGVINFNVDADLRTETDFSYSVGLRAALWECNCFSIGVETQYFRTRPRINYTHNTGTDVIYAHNRHLEYKEWQIGGALAYRIPIINTTTTLVPYGGVRWAHAWFNTGNLFTSFIPETFFNMRTLRNWGYAVGVTLAGCNRISVTAEARFVNETAFYVNGQLRF